MQTCIRCGTQVPDHMRRCRRCRHPLRSTSYTSSQSFPSLQKEDDNVSLHYSPGNQENDYFTSSQQGDQEIVLPQEYLIQQSDLEDNDYGSTKVDEKTLRDLYNAVQTEEITDPATIRKIATSFEAVARDPQASQAVDFDAARAAYNLFEQARQCEKAEYSPKSQVQQHKIRHPFLIGLLTRFSTQYNPQKGTWGCAFMPITSVGLVATVVIVTVTGPIMKLYPPFVPSPRLTVSGSIVPGGSVVISGTDFLPGSRVSLTLDGISVVPSGGGIIVKNNDTFNAQVSIPVSWQPKPNRQSIVEAQTSGSDGQARAPVQTPVTTSDTNWPANDASFRVTLFIVSIDGRPVQDPGSIFSVNRGSVTIEGAKDICSSNQNQQIGGTLTDSSGYTLPYTENFTPSCYGTYKDGHIIFTETYTSFELIVTGTSQYIGGNCNLPSPYTAFQLSGDYTAQGAFSGDIVLYLPSSSDFNCTQGIRSTSTGRSTIKGTWKATFSV